MFRKPILMISVCLLIVSAAAGFDSKRSASVTPLTDFSIENLSLAPRFASAEICSVRHDLGPYWLIQHWVTGMELYKSYQDPSQSCTAPYPFMVEEVDIVMFFNRLCTLIVSVDVETADLTVPSCPVPGNLLSISSEWMYVIPGQGLYLLAVPLDSAVAVNGPYFAGFYISNAIDSSKGACVVTDSLTALCTGYNIWDTTIGYIDLANNDYFDFPGRLILFSVGTTGGSGGVQPAPSITLLQPKNNEIVIGPLTLWASETAGSRIIDFVRFDRRSSGGAWTTIGQDNSGNRPWRNGVDTSGSGNGYSLLFNYSSLTEGLYWMRAYVEDTLGRSDVDSHQVTIDPTPPDVNLINPTPYDSICHPLKLEITTADENVTQVRFDKKAAATNYGVTMPLLNQSRYGDIDGDPNDGNHRASGEFGDYYCGPVAGAIAIKYWFDKGYIYCMREGVNYISVDTLVERLAATMQTRANKGTYDDLFLNGMQQYILTHGNELLFNVYRQPSYHTFRTLFQERELVVILALSGTPGLYLVASGVLGLADGQGRYMTTMSDPLTGINASLYMRDGLNGAEVYYGNSWHPVDMIFTVAGYNHTVTRDLVGLDASSVGGWSYDWSASNMVSDSLYFITATATDATGRIGMATSLTRFVCQSYLKGDYDGNGVGNIGDVLYLINFIYKKGTAPVGGAYRVDANCDSEIGISDIIYAIRYFYSQGPEPCY